MINFVILYTKNVLLEGKNGRLKNAQDVVKKPSVQCHVDSKNLSARL